MTDKRTEEHLPEYDRLDHNQLYHRDYRVRSEYRREFYGIDEED